MSDMYCIVSIIQNKVQLAMLGLSSLYLAIGSAYSISCSLGFVYSPLHNFIPYLLVGLGKPLIIYFC